MNFNYKSTNIRDIILFFLNKIILIIPIILISGIDMVVTLAEWLTRWPAKPFPFGSAGSSPAGDEELLFTFYLKKV